MEKHIFNGNPNTDLIVWWLDPKSEHGLGEVPLKLFLRLAATKSWGEATFGIDPLEGFHSRMLEGKYNVKLVEDIQLDKNVDIWTVLELSYQEDETVVRRIIPVVIENGSKDDDDLGNRYIKAVISYNGDEGVELVPMGILLTAEPEKPLCDQLNNITYQELIDNVIEPLKSQEVLASMQYADDNSKYVVSYKGQEVFANKSLSKGMAACAIFKAYLMEYPSTTLDELRKAFPCEELNEYYYGRYYSDLFYESNPSNIDESGYEVLVRTAGEEKGYIACAHWDFYLDDEKLLPIENGTKKAMCVKKWQEADFNKLVEFVQAKGYDKFIKIE